MDKRRFVLLRDFSPSLVILGLQAWVQEADVVIQLEFTICALFLSSPW
jgi:hypothetical protein